MAGKHIHRKLPWTAEDRARHEAIREQFQREKPGLDQLLATGEYEEPMTLGEYFQVQQIIRLLKDERVRQGLSLADVAARSTIDETALARLEAGELSNPPIAMVLRYAGVLGKEIPWRLTKRTATERQRSSPKAPRRRKKSTLKATG